MQIAPVAISPHRSRTRIELVEFYLVVMDNNLVTTTKKEAAPKGGFQFVSSFKPIGLELHAGTHGEEV